MKLRTSVLAATGVAILAAGFFAGRALAGGIPSTAALTYSGTLEDATGAPLTGSHNIQVDFWNAAAGGTTPACLTTSVAVVLDKGRFSVALPDTCASAVKASPDVWAEVLVDGASLGRSKIGAVPYAVEAGHATKADGASAGTFSVPGNLAVSGNATVAGTLSAGFHWATNCSTTGSLTTCTCDANEIAIAGGGNPTTSSGNGYLSSSRPIIYSSTPTGTWEVGCKSDTGAPIACATVDVLCARVAP
jgi:hypothetical protein